VPPDAEAERVAASGVDMDAAATAFFSQFPGLGELLEPENPGMHTSQTVDYIVVLSGEVDLELDAGERRRLRAGDCVIQNATRHAWRNPGSVDCVMAVVVVGARETG
jgi:mannose-6-phosphate isomerase-like protein (cupin superfamily)